MSTPAHAVHPQGRKPMTEAEKKAKAAAREQARKDRQKHLNAMSDDQRAHFINNERAKNFKELGSMRVTKAVIAIARCKNLASRNYNFTTEQAQKAIDALQNEVDSVISAFKARLAGGSTKTAERKVEL